MPDKADAAPVENAAPGQQPAEEIAEEDRGDFVRFITAAVLLLAPIAGYPVGLLIEAKARKEFAQGKKFQPPPGRVTPGSDHPWFILLMAYNTRGIVRAALLEGPTFFMLVIYMLERNQLFLAIAALLVCIMICLIPTPGRMTTWVENQVHLVERDKGRS